VVLLRRDYDGRVGIDYPDCKMGMEILGVNMISGNHAHYCKQCEKFWPCEFITHCRMKRDATCLDCIEQMSKDIKDMANYVAKQLGEKEE